MQEAVRGTARKKRNLVAVLAADPGLGEDLSDQQLAVARTRAFAELLHFPAGSWAAGSDQFEREANLGLLLIEGLLAREVTVGDYTCAELLGPGDVLQPWLRIGPDDSVATDVDWEVVDPASLAVLGQDFLTMVAPWPEIIAAVARRLMERTHWLAFHLAVCGLRRVDDRLLIVLWHFADRWGTVTTEGVRVDIRLTHDLLASVIGARRPSVSTAMKRLIERKEVRSLPRSRWLLLGDPPAELREVHERGLSQREGRDRALG
jgi:CRP/FNR family cyclic AMP-dependent transcriptional regulator